MGVIKVEIPDVQNLSVATREVADGLGQIVTRLTTDVESIIGTTWIGADASSFADGFSQWRDGAQQVKVALSEIAVLLGQAGGTYDTTESTIASQFAP